MSLVQECSALPWLVPHFALATLGVEIDDIGSEGPSREDAAAALAAQLVSRAFPTESFEVIVAALRTDTENLIYRPRI